MVLFRVFKKNRRSENKDDNNLKESNEGPWKYKNMDDEIMETMQAQLHIPDSLKGKNIEAMTAEDWDKMITPEDKELVRKLRELLDD